LRGPSQSAEEYKCSYSYTPEPDSSQFDSIILSSILPALPDSGIKAIE